MRPVAQIEFSPHFVRSMKGIPSRLADEVEERVAMFRTDCFDARLKTHKLVGKYKNYWSFSVTQKHRIVFAFVTPNTVEFIDVGDHSIYH